MSFSFSLFVCGVGLAALWPSVAMTQQALPDALVQNLVATAQEIFGGARSCRPAKLCSPSMMQNGLRQ